MPLHYQETFQNIKKKDILKSDILVQYISLEELK